MVPSSEHPVEIAALFATERACLLGLLATVTDEEWRRPSPCPEWTVLGLCCHLVGDDFSMLSRHRDGYHGTPAPDGLAEAGFIAWIDNLQIEWVHAARRLSPRLVVDLLGPILDGLRWAYPYRLAAIPAQPGDFVSIEITGPVTASWHLVATGSAWTFRTEPASRRVASLSMTTDQAWRLLTNNLPADEHPRLQLSGNEQITDALHRTRAIIGLPK